MKKNAIRQCPFCCSGGAIVTALHVPEGMAPRYAVVCDDCDAQGPPGETHEEAIGEWADRQEVDDLGDLDDVSIGVEAARRPEVLEDLVGTALLGYATAALFNAGYDLHGIAEMVLRTKVSHEGDDEGGDG